MSTIKLFTYGTLRNEKTRMGKILREACLHAEDDTIEGPFSMVVLEGTNFPMLMDMGPEYVDNIVEGVVYEFSKTEWARLWPALLMYENVGQLFYAPLKVKTANHGDALVFCLLEPFVKLGLFKDFKVVQLSDEGTINWESYNA